MKWNKYIVTLLYAVLVASCSSSPPSNESADSMSDTNAADDSEPVPDSVDVSEDTATDTAGDSQTKDTVDTNDTTTVSWVPDAPVQATLFAGSLGQVEGITFDGQGQLWVSSPDGKVRRLTADGEEAQVLQIEKVESFPSANLTGLAWHDSWGLVVAQFSGSRIHRLTGESFSVYVDGLDKSPNGLTFDSLGRLYVSLSDSGRILRFDSPNDNQEVEVASGLSFPNGIVLSQDSKTLYYCSTTPGSLMKLVLNEQGLASEQPTTIAQGPDLAGADGLSWTPDGWLAVAAFGGSRLVAVHPQDGTIRVISEEPTQLLTTVASPAFGVGPDFDTTCLYATSLLLGHVLSVCP